MQEGSSREGNDTENQEATTGMNLRFGWKWIVRVWAVAFIPVTLMLIMNESDSIVIPMFTLLSLFVFLSV